MLIAGFHSGHECSYCILEDGIPILHAELERYIRQKEPFGDGLKLLFQDYPKYNDIKHFTHTLCTWQGGIQNRHPDTYKKMYNILYKNNGNFYAPGHHQAHAASAFFSSNLDEALIITIDGGGREYYRGDIVTSAATVWQGLKNKILPILVVPDNGVFTTNIGVFWSIMTEHVFGLSVGHPKGNQAGTVMAMAAFGDPNRFSQELLKNKFVPWKFKYKEYQKDTSEQYKFDLAAGLQHATEIMIKDFIKEMLKLRPNKNLCLSGGVALNSVMVGKMLDWFDFDNIYVDPVPYDGGLSIGSSQYVWHHILDNPRIKVEDNYTSYLGKKYSEESIRVALAQANIKKELSWEHCKDEKVISLLEDQKIISVFNDKSESGRRALGNRSILADPRQENMKDHINEKVKHRVWFRPFAPSILREEVTNWFTRDVNSPYMSFVLEFKKEKAKEVPAVVHKNGTARLQTVSEKDNPWYYKFIKKWKNKTGIPILLNTSFNDSEPIVETPEDAILCFMKTDIDYLYFVDVSRTENINILVKKV